MNINPASSKHLVLQYRKQNKRGKWGNTQGSIRKFSIMKTRKKSNENTKSKRKEGSLSW